MVTKTIVNRKEEGNIQCDSIVSKKEDREKKQHMVFNMSNSISLIEVEKIVYGELGGSSNIWGYKEANDIATRRNNPLTTSNSRVFGDHVILSTYSFLWLKKRYDKSRTCVVRSINDYFLSKAGWLR